jgi:hypothetical protein
MKVGRRWAAAEAPSLGKSLNAMNHVNSSNKENKVKKCLISSILLLVVLTSCSNISQVPKIDIGDGGLISQFPCGPLCFFNITPGTTTLDQAKIIMHSIDPNGICTYYDDKHGIKAIKCNPVTIINYGESNDLVEGISFIPQQQITLGEILNLYGPPDYIGKGLFSRNDIPFNMNIIIYYEIYRMDISFEHQINESMVYELNEKTIVESIRISSDNIFNLENTGSIMWNGYGEY